MYNEKVVEEKEELKASIGLKIACFLVPLAGLIIYLSYSSTNRKYATECGKISLISAIIAITLPILILIGILVLGLGIYIFNSSASKIETLPKDSMTTMEISSYNSSLEAYEGTNVQGITVKSLINIIDTKENYNDIKILLDDVTYSDTTAVKAKIKNYSTYNVSFKYNTKGLITKVIIAINI